MSFRFGRELDGLLVFLGGPLFGVDVLLQSLDAILQIVSEATCYLGN
jgi:hypothetical protein